MDKFINHAAIYLTIKNEKENNYFIFQKIKRMKEYCERKDIEIKHIFVVRKNQKGAFKEKQYLMNQIKRNQINLLIIEDSEDVSQIEEIKIEKITSLSRE